MKVFSLSAQHVDESWLLVEGLLRLYERKCQELTALQIREACRNCKMQLFGLADQDRIYGIAVTEIQDSVRGKVCVIVVGVGMGGPYWKDLLDRIHAWAKEIGCIAVRIIGRKGWLRYDRRFKRTRSITMESPL